MKTTIDNFGKSVTYEIRSDGTMLSQELRYRQIKVVHEVNRIGYAEIQVYCGDMPKSNIPESAASYFMIGSKIDILLGFESDNKKVFSGVVTSQRIRMLNDMSGPMLLLVTCKSHAIKATIQRKNRVFIKKSDKEIISEVLSSNGLSVKSDATQVKHEQMVQYYCTDWDFALSRADACGLLLTTKDKTVEAVAPDFSKKEVLTVKYGHDMYSFDAELIAENQVSSAQCIGWSPKEQRLLFSEVNSSKENNQGNVTSSQLSRFMGSQKLFLQNEACNDNTVLKDWGASQLMRSNLSRYRGKFSFCGCADVEPCCMIKLEGMGDRFNGNVFVGSVTHIYQPGSWITEVGMGVSSFNITEQTDVMAPAASGFLPGIEGLHIGVVQKLSGDPMSEFRVQVKLPLHNDNEGCVWARLSQMLASDGSGCHFVPLVGDEVILGFVNNDPTMAIILGSLYSSKNNALFQYDDQNFKRAIVSPKKMTFLMDDENQSIKIGTPGGNEILICEKEKKVTVVDQNANKLEMTGDGIAISTKKTLTIDATDIKMSAKKNIQMSTSTGDLKMEAKNIELKAKINAKVNSSLATEVSASVNTTIKGALVKIN